MLQEVREHKSPALHFEDCRSQSGFLFAVSATVMQKGEFLASAGGGQHADTRRCVSEGYTVLAARAVGAIMNGVCVCVITENTECAHVLCLVSCESCRPVSHL